MVKTTRPKVTLLPSVIRSWQKGYVLPPVTSAQRKTVVRTSISARGRRPAWNGYRHVPSAGRGCMPQGP